MLKARAVKSFRRSDQRTWVKRGQDIEGDDEYIKNLERVGNVRSVAAVDAAPENKGAEENPDKTVGEKSSASQAGQASQQTKSDKSENGGKEKDPKEAPESESKGKAAKKGQ